MIGAGASVGARTIIHPHVVIGDGTTIGADCIIHAHVSIRERCSIGARVIVQNGAVVGSDGYGFAQRADGSHEKIPQTGPVVIEDDVEIGANTTIDRPAVGETRIMAGTKIDNLVQIAHGVVVGRNSLLAAQVGIAGSTVIGESVMFGGQVGDQRAPDDWRSRQAGGENRRHRPGGSRRVHVRLSDDGHARVAACLRGGAQAAGDAQAVAGARRTAEEARGEITKTNFE